MKLRNKKTGEIIDKWPADMVVNSGKQIYSYKTLADLCEEWEDYEESDEFWYIDPVAGIVCEPKNPDLWDEEYDIELMKSIGNYFGTNEQAKKAVEKLKAWKRLRSRGFGFENWNTSSFNNGVASFFLPDVNPKLKEYRADLDLLFGGKGC